VNPPELGIMEVEIKKVQKGRYILLPISDETRGMAHIDSKRSGATPEELMKISERSISEFFLCAGNDF